VTRLGIDCRDDAIFGHTSCNTKQPVVALLEILPDDGGDELGSLVELERELPIMQAVEESGNNRWPCCARSRKTDESPSRASQAARVERYMSSCSGARPTLTRLPSPRARPSRNNHRVGSHRATWDHLGSLRTQRIDRMVSVRAQQPCEHLHGAPEKRAHARSFVLGYLAVDGQ